jgi:catalase
VESLDAFAEQVVDSINDVSGRHPGARASHAKGIVLEGTFTPSGAGLTRAAHMQEETVRVVARVSNGGGDPHTPDGAREGRGLAVKFDLPDGTRTDVVTLSLPCFFVRTPEDFLELTRARRPDPATGRPDLERVGAFLAAHPEALPAVQAALGAEPPESYATVTYHSIHSFRWIDAAGGSRFVRYRFEPEAGERTVPDERARELGPDYLVDEIAARETPAAFRMLAVIAGEGDDVNDSTVAWPEDRERVEVGRLELTGLDHSRERDGDILVFDPLRLTDGIEPSDDPILHFRPRAYSVSVARRTGG